MSVCLYECSGAYQSIQFNTRPRNDEPIHHPPSWFIVDPVQRYLVQPTNHQRQSQRSDTDDDGDDFCDDWDEEEDSGGGGGWVVLVVVVVIFSETLL